MEDFEEKVLKRFHSLNEIYTALSAQLKWDKMYLNKELLLFACRKYYMDIFRYKHEVDTQFVDQHKRAAYTVKWLSVVRPIQFKEGEKMTKAELAANGFFALIAGLNHLDIEISDISNGYLKHWLHATNHRYIYGRQMASEFYVLEKSLKGDKP